MTRGCVPGLVHRWSWWVWPEQEEEGGGPPEEGDIAVHRRTGSCYLVLDVKRSPRKSKGWWVLRMEGLGVGAAKLGDEGTFGYAPLTSEDYEAIRMIEAARKLED